MPGIGIIANPHSKSNKRSPTELKRLEQVIGQKGVMTVTRDLKHLDETIERYRDMHVSTIALNGGDGTISQAITRMIALYGDQPLPTIAVLRGGTMNLVAAQLGIRGKPSEILERLISQKDNGSAQDVESLSTMKVNDIYGFIYADQSSTSILEEFYQKKTGRVGASFLSMRLIRSFLLRGPLIRRMIRSHHLKADFKPTGRINQSALGCFAGTITKFPMGLPFLTLAREKPGHFQTTIVTCKPENLLWYLPLLMLQQNEGAAPGKLSVCCEKAHLEYEGSVHFTVDGEIYRNPNGLVTIEAGPQIPFLKL